MPWANSRRAPSPRWCSVRELAATTQRAVTPAPTETASRGGARRETPCPAQPGPIPRRYAAQANLRAARKCGVRDWLPLRTVRAARPPRWRSSRRSSTVPRCHDARMLTAACAPPSLHGSEVVLGAKRFHAPPRSCGAGCRCAPVGLDGSEVERARLHRLRGVAALGCSAGLPLGWCSRPSFPASPKRLALGSNAWPRPRPGLRAVK